MPLFLTRRRRLRRAGIATALIAMAALVATGPPAHARQAAASVPAASVPAADGASGWLPVASPPAPPAGDIGAISALAPAGPGAAWAVGTSHDAATATILTPAAYRWSGGRWVSTPIAYPAPSEEATSVADGGAGDAWMTGEQSPDPATYPYWPRLRHWDGHAWQLASFPGDTQTTSSLRLSQVAAAGGKAWIITQGASYGILGWDGTRWTQQQVSAASLADISADSATDAWAAGVSASGYGPLVLHWNGTSWQDESPANQALYLDHVAASGPRDVWATGVALRPDGTGLMAADHWNGTSWTEYPIPALPGMSRYDSPLGLTVDRSGNPWVAAYSNRADRTAYFHWSGAAWQVSYGARQPGVIESSSSALATLPVSGAILSVGTSTPFGKAARNYAEVSPAPAALARSSASFHFPAADGQAAAASPTALTALSATAPSAWTPARLPAMPPQDSLNGVAATAGGTAWAVGEQYQGIIAPGYPLVLRSGHGGWFPVPLRSVRWQGSLTGVAAVSPADAWAIGTDVNGDPHILHGTGGTWRDVPFPGSGSAQVTLVAIAAAPGVNPWVAANGPYGPVLLHWTGARWATMAAPPGDTGLTALTVHSATDVWVAGASEPDPSNDLLAPTPVSHWNGTAWTTLGTTNTDHWEIASIVAAGPDDVWVSGGVAVRYPPDSPPSPLIGHWNGTSWSQASLSFPAGYLPSLTVGPGGQPAWASVTPYAGAAPGTVNLPQGHTVFLRYDGSAWTLSYGPAPISTGNPGMFLAAVPGTTRTLAAGTAPYSFGSQVPLIEANGP
jgi:hypothetical protein